MNKDPRLSLNNVQKEPSTTRPIIKQISTIHSKNIRTKMIKIMFNFLFCFYFPEIKEIVR